jgi:iron(II)-dependent oxidoreductase
MSRHELLGQLSGLHQMLVHLVESLPEADCYRTFNPAVPPMAWLLGRSVYMETYWLREVVQQDDDMTARVRALFAHDVEVNEQVCSQLPPLDHLLNWTLELQDENLTRLANPVLLPDHPLLEEDALLLYILQEHARLYELMLVQMTERQLEEQSGYQVSKALVACAPSEDHADLHQGHYRIGAKNDPAACDNELPPQMVQLDAFRIDRLPVTNGAYLSFIEAGGYQEKSFWSEAGWAWCQGGRQHPHAWRRDVLRRWYSIGLNGPCDLVAEDAVSGLSHHEALAYANWVSSLGGKLAGAVVQHEYQWEVAARTSEISRTGQVWEWCANPFHPYTGYTPPQRPEAATKGFDDGHFTLRGASLHTQRVLRRASYRHHALPEQRFRFSGTRLVFPPSKMAWHK